MAAHRHGLPMMCRTDAKVLSAKAIGDLKVKFDKDKDKKLSLSEFKGIANDVSKKLAALLCLAAAGMCV